MTPLTSNTFHISIGSRRLWLLVVPVALVLVLSWPHFVPVVVLSVQIALALALVVVFGTVSVSSTGIVLYRVNRLLWANIKSVTPRSVLGLRYLHITRIKGFGGWWLPLYLQEPARFFAAIAANAPAGNPLRNYAEFARTQPTVQPEVPASGRSSG